MTGQINKSISTTRDRLKHASNYSKSHMLIVSAIFALVGGYVIYHSFAAGVLGSALPPRMPFSNGGSTYYVDGTNGSDSNSGSSAAPWKTINKALSAVPLTGSIIRVKPGTYYSAPGSYVITFTRQASSTNPITLMADQPGTVMIASNTTTAPTIGAWVLNASGLRIQGLKFRVMNDPSVNSGYEEVLIENSDSIELANNTFYETAGQAIVTRGGQQAGQTSDNIWIINNIFRPSGTNPYAQVTGAGYPSNVYYGSKGSHWIYAGQWGADPCSGCGWDAVNGGTNLVIANNVFVGAAAGRDIELGPENRTGYVVNNTFYGNQSLQTIGPGAGPGSDASAVYAGQGLVFFSNTANTAYDNANNIVANNIFNKLFGHAVAGSGSTEPGNVVQKNLAYGNDNGQGYDGPTTLDYMYYYGTTSSILFSTGTGNLPAADPQFNNPMVYDYTLKSNSPAIGKADLAYAFPTDINGNPRSATAPSLGAIEPTVTIATPPPTVSLSASPASISAGGSSTLSWSSTNATSCSASGAWTSASSTSGSQTVSPSSTSTYTLTCNGTGGSASASTTLNVSAAVLTTSLTNGMTITPPYTWTFNPGFSTVKGYFWADGTMLYSSTPNASGTYTYILPTGLLSAGAHLLGHGWDLADGTHQSGPSNYSVTIVGGDVTPPVINLTSPANGTSVSGNVTATSTASDNIGVSKVEFYVDGNLAASDTATPYTYVWDSTGVSNGSHNLSAKAYDAAGNNSSSQVTVTVANADTTPPSVPTGLSANATAYNNVNLSWTASTDNIAVSGYYIVRNGTTIAQTAGTTYSDTTVNASTNYNYQIMAYDAKNNTSLLSAGASVTTPSALDTTPPSAPSTLLASGISYSQINLSWTASTDNVGVTSYDIYRNSAKLASISSANTSFGDSGLGSGLTYSYYVIARDAAGNSSLGSNTATAATLVPPPVTTGSLEGIVYSSKGGVVSGVVIQLSFSGATHSYSSNSLGQYTVSNIPAGNYTVTFSKRRFTTQNSSVSISSGVTTTKNVTLVPSRSH